MRQQISWLRVKSIYHGLSNEEAIQLVTWEMLLNNMLAEGELY